MQATSNDVQEMIAATYAPIDHARAEYRGVSIVGHRRSASAGEMLWALPGGACLTSGELAARDPQFKVLSEPSAVTLSLVHQTLQTLGEPCV